MSSPPKVDLFSILCRPKVRVNVGSLQLLMALPVVLFLGGGRGNIFSVRSFQGPLLKHYHVNVHV